MCQVNSSCSKIFLLPKFNYLPSQITQDLIYLDGSRGRWPKDLGENPQHAKVTLFSPTKLTTCPVSLDELTGKRATLARPLHGGPEAKIEDDLSIQ